MRSKFTTVLKGFCIGGSMLVPGVSGGSMAMILGIYDTLISSVSTFFRDIRKNLLFFCLFLAGAALGMLLCANPLLRLIERYPMPMLYLFMGAVAGGVPMIFRHANVGALRPRILLYPVAGAGAVMLLSRVPENLFGAGNVQSGNESPFMLLLGGIVAAVALILPGVSVSYMLLIMGLYDQTIEAVSALRLTFLLPLAVGLGLGILLTTRLLERAMTRRPQATYLLILGFVLGSVIQIFPGLPTGWQLPLCGVAFAVGAAGIWSLSRLN